MVNVTLGDLAQAHQLRRETTALKSEVQRLSAEVTTGRAADTARAVRGDLMPLAAIETSLARAAGFRTATAEATVFAQGMTRVLEHLGDLATELGTTILTAASSANATMLDVVATDAGQRFDAAVSALNTRLGDRTLFAGTETSRPALAGSAAMLDALTAAVAGATTADQVETAVRAWFDAPGGFGAAYLGGDASAALPISPEDQVRLDVTARDPAVRDTLAGLAMAALLDRGVPVAHGERAALAQRAGEQLFSGQSARAALLARLGVAEARIDATATRNDAEASALEIARADLLAVDDYAAATRLEAAQTQLETLYAVTARLSRLSLVDFLR